MQEYKCQGVRAQGTCNAPREGVAATKALGLRSPATLQATSCANPCDAPRRLAKTKLAWLHDCMANSSSVLVWQSNMANLPRNDMVDCGQSHSVSTHL
ncbi:hypothetical protein HaLaN_06625 [Haematococcus lacustris]|uniref:Uncharacterized protein n=1 Tax=Haematococcus lacustris TaxID=44745 RepID=A0A699YMD1_HAELA|nr:hypothetical protein HaLaN_06625 [Haematococcus lacustris]